MSDLRNEWDIKRTTFSVSDFVSWNRQGTLELSPSFQRRSVLTKPQKSYLVDTVYRGLPIPIVFIRDRTDVESLETIREIVDGQQRLRTLIAYADLENLKNPKSTDDFEVLTEHNKKLSGRKFHTLSVEKKHRILSYQFSVHVLPSDTSDADVLKIFARMNSTGTKLNAQELRNAEYFGHFKTVVYDLATSQLSRWRSWKVLSEQDIARMKDAELTSQLLLLLDAGLFEKTQPVLDDLYKRYDERFPKSLKLQKEFRDVMEEIDETFGAELPRSNFKKNAQFFQLFNLVMNLKRENVRISKKVRDNILSLGERIKDRIDLPSDVEIALTARFNRLSNQKTLASFLRKNATG